MSKKDDTDNATGVSFAGFWIMVAILSVAFYGEPDLVGSIIQYLQARS